jgi:glycosyltransferase involved in cell wall biosynthesis
VNHTITSQATVLSVDAKTNGTGNQVLFIGLVTETYAPEVNGVAMTLNRLANGLDNRGHRVDVYRPRQSPADTPVTQNNTKQIPLPGMAIPGYREMHFGFPARKFFLQQWNMEKPDVLYVATEGPLGASAINAAAKLNIPVISGFHTNFHTYSSHYRLGWLSPVILAYLRRLHNKTNMTLVPTKVLADDLRMRGFNNVEVMQRGVDTGLFTPSRRNDELRRRWQTDDDTIVCLYVGRIAAEKNIQQAIETMQALSMHYKVRFVFVGDGPLREKLQKQNCEFVFCGTQRGEALAAHYASADVLLFPSRTETFGNVVTEAMASGLAVVAYNEAAAHEHITDWHNGVLVRDNNKQCFTSVAMRLCKQPAAIKKIGANAADYCRGLGWPFIITQFESLLNNVCQQPDSITGKDYYPRVSS